VCHSPHLVGGSVFVAQVYGNFHLKIVVMLVDLALRLLDNDGSSMGKATAAWNNLLVHALMTVGDFWPPN
jgi:hypothetical protein